MGVRVEVHIERLVVDAMGRCDGHRLAASLEGELHRLLTDRGAPQRWRTSGLRVGQLRLETVDATNPRDVGKRLAAAAYDAGREPSAGPRVGGVAPKPNPKEGNLQ